MESKIKNLTINDLDKNSFVEYRTKVLDKMMPILQKYFDKKAIQSFNPRDYWFAFMKKDDKFKRSQGKSFDSVIRYSTRKQKIPLDFDCVMTVVLEKDMTTIGIFRISTNYILLDEVENELFRLIELNITRDEILEYLRKFDIILLTTLFSRLFTHYNTPLFPNNLMKIALRTNDIQEERDKFKVFKLIITAFPYSKRTMFESVGKFIKTVSDINIAADQSKSKSMTLNGCCKVLAPRIFITFKENVKIEILFKYIEILDYIFGNMPAVMELETLEENN